MKIYTSYYANIKNIPENYKLISISGGLSESLRKVVDKQDKRLAPTYQIFQNYKNNPDEELYIKEFSRDVLENRDIHSILSSWAQEFGPNARVVLLCYEKPEDFCHRQLVAEKIEDLYDVKVKEIEVSGKRTKGRIV